MSMHNNRRRVARKKRDYRRMLSTVARTTLGVAVVAGMVMAGVGLNRMFSVDRWHISGVSPELAHEIEHQLAKMGSMDFIHSRPAYLCDRLSAAIPDLASVSISRHLPDTLEIKAVPRVPIAFWQGEKGDIWLIDSEGEAYRKLQADEHYDLPLLRMQAQARKQAIALLQALHETAPGRYAALSEFIARFDSWQMDFNHGQSWLLPRGEQAAHDLHKVVALLHDQRLRGGDWKVDARMQTRWFIRKAGQGGVV